MLIEMECLCCGDHEMCDPHKSNICHGCDNGIMVNLSEVFSNDN
jgi:hypothetical protein